MRGEAELRGRGSNVWIVECWRPPRAQPRRRPTARPEEPPSMERDHPVTVPRDRQSNVERESDACMTSRSFEVAISTLEIWSSS